MSTNKSSFTRRFLTPITGKPRPSTHVLLWTHPDSLSPAGERNVAGSTMECGETGVTLSPVWQQMSTSDHVDAFIDSFLPRKSVLTIWIPGGFEDFAASRLAALADAGIITWRYLNLSAERVLLRGQYRGKSIIVASLSGWTGGPWDAWSGKTDARGQDLFAASIKSVAETSLLVRCGRIPPTAGEAGIRVWRSWLGPAMQVVKVGRKDTLNEGKVAENLAVSPSPFRPARVSSRERHAVYGMVRRFLWRGHQPGPIYHVDLKSAYLAALVVSRLPVMYLRTLRRPDMETLAKESTANVLCGLFHVKSGSAPLPLRRGGLQRWCTGDYWTWLCGSEAAVALEAGAVAECDQCHVWGAIIPEQKWATNCLRITEIVQEQGGPLAKLTWRSMYSHLVGRWAGWRRNWVDCDAHSGLGRWASWNGFDSKTGEITRYRTVAGRTQKLEGKQESAWSVPLLFGCVTSWVRIAMLHAAWTVDADDLLAIDCDSLWLTERGWNRYQQRMGDMPRRTLPLHLKDSYDAAETLDDHRVIVWKGGEVYARIPGIPGDIPTDDAGIVHWKRNAGLGDVPVVQTIANIRGGQRKAKAAVRGREMESTYERLPLAESLIDPFMHESLTSPYQPEEKMESPDEHESM